MIPAQLFGPELGVAVRALVPEWLVPVFVAITTLGNVAVLFALFTVDYWFWDHRRGAHAVGLAIAGIGLVTALKFFFSIPRPPPSVTIVAASGYSFPSGHATMAAIGYGILAYDVRIGPRWLRYGAAGILIVLIALSRVVLGVHFVRDIVAGVLLGVAFLAVAIALTRHAPRPAFLLGLGLAGVAVVTSGASHDAIAVLGLSVGATLAWHLLDNVPRLGSTRVRVALLTGGLPLLLVVAYFSTREGIGRPLAFILSTLVTASIVVAPHVAKTIE